VFKSTKRRKLLRRLERNFFDLDEISIVSYCEEISLKQLMRAVRAQNSRMVIVVDTDEQGVKAERLARERERRLCMRRLLQADRSARSRT
jgi:hypothetical protein